MHFPTLLLTIVAFRYRLLWAAVRTRSGRVALFVVGYLATLIVGGFSFLGGMEIGAAAMASGRGLLLYQVSCSALFVSTVAATVVLGVGVNRPLSDQSLLRFPLSRNARFTGRHLGGVLDPLWLLLLSLYVGLAVGGARAVWSAATLWLPLPAALLLLASNYLAASVILSLVETAIRTRRGSLALVIAFALLLSLAPALPMIEGLWGRGLEGGVVAAADWTPPFLAGEAFAHSEGFPLPSVSGLLVWVGLLLVLLRGLEAWQPRSVRLDGAAASWDTAYDRLAALFGSQLAPLVGKLLRYAARCPQARLAWISILPSFVLFLVTGRGSMRFAQALAAFAFFCGNAGGPVGLNLFGFDGSGFRRYLLLPVELPLILRAASLAALIPGALFLPLAIVIWVVATPSPVEPRSVAMLAGSGMTGWLLFATAGLWTSVCAPTASEFDRTWGNKLSLAANAVLVSSIAAFFLVLLVLMRLRVTDTMLVAHWWVTVLAVLVVAGAYGASLVAAGRLIGRRREHMLGAIEGA